MELATNLRTPPVGSTSVRRCLFGKPDETAWNEKLTNILKLQQEEFEKRYDVKLVSLCDDILESEVPLNQSANKDDAEIGEELYQAEGNGKNEEALHVANTPGEDPPTNYPEEEAQIPATNANETA
ncbi:Hypothetical predicted protein [Cloeon dipterum]|uniref:Uncharacterized protein n=1 Tax=Cloeon dipterum TaxID=197152 RepID=A0A8S1BUR0_9INSE|nr:Hypothetical predicted protein [Cloeon dipterum]